MLGNGRSEARAVWDVAASTFDDEPDHGLKDPQVRQAWARLMVETLGSAPLRIADLGCGTGSLSLLLHALGHQVTGLDVSPRMLAKARQKAGSAVTFVWGMPRDQTCRACRSTWFSADTSSGLCQTPGRR